MISKLGKLHQTVKYMGCKLLDTEIHEFTDP